MTAGKLRAKIGEIVLQVNFQKQLTPLHWEIRRVGLACFLRFSTGRLLSTPANRASRVNRMIDVNLLPQMSENREASS